MVIKHDYGSCLHPLAPAICKLLCLPNTSVGARGMNGRGIVFKGFMSLATLHVFCALSCHSSSRRGTSRVGQESRYSIDLTFHVPFRRLPYAV